MQYALVERAVALGWWPSRVLVIDEDLGHSASGHDTRPGFARLVSEVGLDHVGIVLGIEMSRLARSGREWHQLLELCAMSGTLLGDPDEVYDPADHNDRMLLGLKGTISGAELFLIKQRMWSGRLDALHRSHATVEDRVRTNKAMGLRNLPSERWNVNAAWTLAANIAADLDAWTRLLGLHDDPESARAEPDTMRYRLYHLPARLVRHARRKILKTPATGSTGRRADGLTTRQTTRRPRYEAGALATDPYRPRTGQDGGFEGGQPPMTIAFWAPRFMSKRGCHFGISDLGSQISELHAFAVRAWAGVHPG